MNTVLLYVIGVAAVALGIGVSIGLHEAGHLLAAKAFGIKVTKYFVGFGPTVWLTRKGETEYGIKAIPLGGFCSLVGMYPPSKDAVTRGGYFHQMAAEAREESQKDVLPGEEHRAFYAASVWKRLVVMVAGIAMNMLLGVVFFAIAVGAFGTAQVSTTVSSISQCVLPASSSRQTCEDGDPEAPGAAAGFQSGDRIVSIDGAEMDSWAQISSLIQESAGTTLTFVVDRGGDDVTLSVTPTTAERTIVDDDGSTVTRDVGFVGISAGTEMVRQPVTEAIPLTGQAVSEIAQAIVTLPQKVVGVVDSMFGGTDRATDSPVSVVGVGRAAGEIASSSAIPAAAKWASIFSLLGALNVSLAMFNVIPLLPLDGGHAAGALWEAVRRGWARLRGRRDPGPFDASRWLPLTTAVTVLLLVFGGILILADFVDPVTLFG